MEPRWPATVALLTIGALNLVLPRSLTLGPEWLLLVIVCVMLVPIILTHRRGRYQLNHAFAMTLAVAITIELMAAVALLLAALPAHTETPAKLLQSAAVLWFTNVLVFAYWYWRLDAGGPNQRAKNGQKNGSFYFPQLVRGDTGWRPGFIDYLFLAFTTSTAFSPTDTPVLSPWAKALTMLQAAIAFSTVTVLLARAINLL